MKKKILIISMITLVITLIGSTYAFFMYSKTTKAFTLTSGDINIEFVNGDNNINLTYAYPISDNYAKDNLENLGYIDFSVIGKITEDRKVINYEIYLEEDSKNTLDSNYIKVYLTDDTNKEIVSPKTYNSLDKTSYTNSDNGKVIYKVSKKGEFNDKYRIYVWIDSGYTQNVIQERFSFKVNLYAYNDTETAVSVIKSNLVKYSESSKDTFTGGLVAVNTNGELYNETDSKQTIREYRYSGPNVNNYVTFNDETWRIIGVFKDEQGNELVKIIRNSMLEASLFPETYTLDEISYNIKAVDGSNLIYWNYTTQSDYGDWNKAGLQYFLNTEQDDNQTNGYLHFLSNDAKRMIKETKYYLGNVNIRTNTTILTIDTTILAYNNERGTKSCTTTCSGGDIWDGNQAIWTGKIGLMYPSDVGYSAKYTYWKETDLNQYSTEAWSTSWLKEIFKSWQWLLSPTSHDKNVGSDWSATGYLHYSNDLNRNFVQPTLYLKSNVKIVSGTGEKNSPFEITL